MKNFVLKKIGKIRVFKDIEIFGSVEINIGKLFFNFNRKTC